VRPAEIVRRAAAYLDRHDVESPLAEAEVLLAQVLRTDRAGLYSSDRGLSGSEARRFGRALCRRCVGTPLQHLTGEQGFRRLTLVVRPGVFIPRPETEVVVEQALASIEGVAEPVVIDVGTGTGAIALAVKDERPDARVKAIDISPEAIALAAENAARLHLEIALVQGDLLDPVPREILGSVDLVVSNPPYIEAEALPALPREVRRDPELALVGGVEIYRRLFAGAVHVLRPGGAVVAEVEERAAGPVGDVAEAAGLVAVRILPDLTGRDRVLVARTPC
jgi:release factor glutamine methyltransferase